MTELLNDARRGMKYFETKLKGINKKEYAKWRKIRAKLKDVQDEIALEFSDEEAELTAWHLFETAVLEERLEQLSSVVNPWMHHWDLRSSPLMLEALMMAFDIGRGFSEEEAYIFHQNWLDEEEDNRIYGNYYFTPDGQVVQITARREHLISIH